MGKRRHAASGRLGRGCPRLRLGPQKARAAPPPASSLQLFRRRRAALRQAAAALHHTRCTCRAACRLRVPVGHAADRRLRGRKITGLPARARHDERRAPPWPVRSRAYHLKTCTKWSQPPLLCLTDFFICGIPFPEAENALQASNFDDRIHASNMRGGTVRTQDLCKDPFEGWCVNDQCKINVRSMSPV